MPIHFVVLRLVLFPYHYVILLRHILMHHRHFALRLILFPYHYVILLKHNLMPIYFVVLQLIHNPYPPILNYYSYYLSFTDILYHKKKASNIFDKSLVLYIILHFLIYLVRLLILLLRL